VRAEHGAPGGRAAGRAAGIPHGSGPDGGSEERIDTSVRCEDCAAVCCRQQVLLLGDAGVPPHLTTTADWGGEVMARLDDGWCAALDRATLRCTIYPQRPQVCRDLPMGGADCRAARAEAGASAGLADAPAERRSGP
jgi:Fe-S-cluster containining protein